MTTEIIASLVREHEVTLQTLQRMRVALLIGDIVEARAACEALHILHAEHRATEEYSLIPRLGEAARWPAKIYLAEHAKMAKMIAGWRNRLIALPDLLSEPQSRLALIDASLPLQHLLERHFEQEDKGLFMEIVTR